MRKIVFLAVLSLLAFMAACHDKEKEQPSHAYKGVVVDNQGNPLSNVLITIGTDSVRTDSMGCFVAPVQPEAVRYVFKLEKPGYFDIISACEAIDTSYMQVVMTRKIESENCHLTSFNTQKGIVVTLNGVKVEIPANGLMVEASGEDYNGNAKIEVYYLNPDDENFYQKMPGGDLLALNSKKDTVLLASYGMVKVEMKSTTGEKLQLRKDKQAKLTYTIPQSLKNETPDTIPLWHFDEKNGLWIEDGLSIHKDNTYEGFVKHFSWINCDIILILYPKALHVHVIKDGEEGWSGKLLAVSGNYAAPINIHGGFGSRFFPILGDTLFIIPANCNINENGCFFDPDIIADITEDAVAKEPVSRRIGPITTVKVNLDDIVEKDRKNAEELFPDSVIYAEKDNCLMKTPLPVRIANPLAKPSWTRNGVMTIDPISLHIENKIKLHLNGDDRKYFSKINNFKQMREDVVECFVDDYKYHKLRLVCQGLQFSKVDTSEYFDSLSKRPFWVLNSLGVKVPEHKHLVEIYEIYQEEDAGIAKRDSLIGITAYYTNDFICELQYTDTANVGRKVQIFPQLPEKDAYSVEKVSKIDASKPVRIIARTCEGYQFSIKGVFLDKYSDEDGDVKDLRRNHIVDLRNDIVDPKMLKRTKFFIEFCGKESIYNQFLSNPIPVKGSRLNKKNLPSNNLLRQLDAVM